MSSQNPPAQFYRRSIPKPTDEYEFEEMCAQIYGAVFGDDLPKRNGRRGQEQHGVDVFVVPTNSVHSRIGIQCKKYTNSTLTTKDIDNDIHLADVASVPISQLIFATTSDSDSRLVQYVLKVSDARKASGKFTVSIEFWDEISAHIKNHTTLIQKYAPDLPGALLSVVDERTTQIPRQMDEILQIKNMVADLRGSLHVPSGRDDSANKIITHQIDRINLVLNEGRYLDALSHLDTLAKDFSSFDPHQRARWHVQRGVIRLHQADEKGAAEDFLQAWSLYPADQKIAAALVRGLTLQNKYSEAIAAGTESLKEFPASQYIWTATAYAKLASGQNISEQDIPSEMVGKIDTVQLMCWNAIQTGDYQNAAKLGRQLLQFPDIGLTGRTIALGSAVSLANADPVAAMFGNIDANARNMLNEVVGRFEPHAEKLWSSQSAIGLPDDVANLAYAYRLLGKPDVALKLLEDAPPVVSNSPKVMSIRIALFRTMHKDDVALEYARAHYATLDPCAILVIGDAAATIGDVDLLDQLCTRIDELTDQIQKDLLTGFRWAGLVFAGRSQEAIDAAALQVSSPEVRIPLLLMASRVYLLCEKTSECNALLDRVKAAIKPDDRTDVRLIFGDLLTMSGRDCEAAEQYAMLAKNGMFSDLHKKLLIAYLKSGQRRKAKELLSNFPAHWSQDDETRDLAIKLAHSASDWSALRPLALLEMQTASDAAGSWILRLAVEEQTGSQSSFKKLLSKISTNVVGKSMQIARLASLEIAYGQVWNGMRRLYCLLRQNFQDPDAASAFLTTMLCNPNIERFMQTEVKTVGANTSCRLTDSHGHVIVLTIDPDDAVCPEVAPEFLSRSNAVVAPVLGKSVGDNVFLQSGIGEPREYQVESITTAFHRLFQITQERASSPLSGMKGVGAVNVIKTDGTTDLGPIKEMLQRQSNYTNLVLEQYASRPITLGICAKLFRTTTAELVLDWPDSAPPIRLSSGNIDDRNRSVQLLHNGTAVVADLATLFLLVSLNVEDILGCFNSVYVSTYSHDVLQRLLKIAQLDTSTGHLSGNSEKLYYTEKTASYRREYVKFLEKVEQVVQKYCEVAPAYGGAELPHELVKFEGHLGEEEYDTILLALEKGVPLISVDYNLQAVAKIIAGVDGIDVPSTIRHALQRGLVGQTACCTAIGTMFIRNFSNVSMDAGPIIWLLLQDPEIRNEGLRRYREMMSDQNLNFDSSVAVIFETIESVINFGWDAEVVEELTELLCEPLFRIPNLSIDPINEMANAVLKMIPRLEMLNPALRRLHVFPGLKNATTRLLMRPIYAARARAKRKEPYMAIDLSVAYVTRIPTLRLGN